MLYSRAGKYQGVSGRLFVALGARERALTTARSTSANTSTGSAPLFGSGTLSTMIRPIASKDGSNRINALILGRGIDLIA